MVQWIDEQLVPVLNNQPTLLAIDLFAPHKTEDVVDTFLAHDIRISWIPGGYTGLVQPLDFSINRPFKDINSSCKFNLLIISHYKYQKLTQDQTGNLRRTAG